MFVVTHLPELSIWLTDELFNKKSGVWYFYDSREEYEDDLKLFKSKYGSKFTFTLKRVQEMYNDRGRTSNDE